MTPHAAVDNLVAWSVQVAAIVAAAAPLPWLLRATSPGLRHAFWRLILFASVALPLLQPWRVNTTTASVAVSMGAAPPLPVLSAGSGASPGLAAILWARAVALAPDWQIVILSVLGAGALARMMWLAAGILRLRRLRRAGERPEETATDAELAALVEAGAEIRYACALRQPVTFGLFKPVVLLPASIPSLPPPIRRAVVAHELWHVRRRDWAWVVSEEVVRAVFWFHPAMWWLVGRVQATREEVVDELTILVTNARRTYLEALLAFADEPVPFPAPPFARRRHLFQRMLLISTEAVMSSKRVVFSFVVMLAVVTAVGSYGVSAFPLRGQETSGSGPARMTFSFTNASLRDVLTFIARTGGVRIAFHPAYRDMTTTVSAQDVTLQDALKIVLLPNGYTYGFAYGPTPSRDEIVVVPLGQPSATPGAVQQPPRDPRPGAPRPATSREAELKQQISKGGAPAPVYLELAKLQEERNAAADAEATLTAARAAFPNNTSVLTTIAAYYNRQGQFDRTIDALEAVAAIDPSDPARHHTIATYYEEKVRKDTALSPGERLNYIQSGIAAEDRALAQKADYVDALVIKNILLRHQANAETDANRRQQLIAEADALRTKAIQLQQAQAAARGGVPGGVVGGVAGGVPRDAPPPPPPPPPPGMMVDGMAPLRVGGTIKTPTKIKDVRPVYPPEAMAAKVTGVVIVEAVIDTTGKVREARVLRSIALLDEAATDAVKQWEFTPTLLNGAPVPVIMTVTVNFTLQ
jgi:TonB family protein